MTNQTPTAIWASLGTLLLLAAWFGLLAGLLEGLFTWGLPVLGLAGSKRFCITELKSLWAPVFVDLALFIGVAIGLFVFSRLLKRLPWLTLAAGIFSTLTAYAALSSTGRLGDPGGLILSIGLGAVVARLLPAELPGRLARMRRSLLPLMALALLLCAGPWPAEAILERLAQARLPDAPADAPSILFIVLDTARADRLGAYGYSRPTTPFLDELARGGVLFENAFANSSWTLPSHVSMLTARLPHEHDAQLRGESFDGRFPTIARVLAGRGYATAAIAANHGYASCGRGVTADFQHCENPPSFSAQLLTFYVSRLRVPGILRRLGFGELPREWITAEEVNQRLLRWVDGRSDRPFFAFLNYNDLHYPYQPPLEYRRRFSEETNPVRLAQWLHMRDTPNALDPAVVRRASDHYDASFAYLDAQLRTLFAALDQRRLTQNLLVVITSDHGESFGEHGLLEHQISLYRDQIHVPLLIHWPNHTPEGLRISAPVGLDQIPATLAALAGVSAESFRGPGLRGYWQDQPPSTGDVLGDLAGGRWEGVPVHWPILHGRLRSLVTERWHFLLRGDGVVELYDWVADPREEQNLASNPAHQDIVTALRARLERATQTGK